MQGLRSIFFRNRWLALALVTLAFAMKAMVPPGFMLVEQTKSVALHICDDMTGQMASHMAAPAPGKEERGKGGQGRHDGICPYSAVSFAALTGADSIQLAFALLFIFKLGFAALLLVARVHVLHLRPPLRGPPAHA